MLKIKKALWHIEGRLHDPDLAMDEVAAAAGVSRFHLSRLFASSIGRSASAYVRARRASRAAESLAQGAANILEVALASGYASHEAFTRAFKDELGVTPESVRASGSTTGLQLTPSQLAIDDEIANLKPPRFETSPPKLLAGLGRRYSGEQGFAGIPDQWRSLAPYFGQVPEALSDIGFGVYHAFDHESAYGYLAALEIGCFSNLPAEFETLRLAGGEHAVFTHDSHVSAIPSTMRAVWEAWAPGRGYTPTEARPFFERYDERFNADTGEGIVEIWIPIKEILI